MAHILIETAKRYIGMGEVENPRGYYFDYVSGYWKNSKTGFPMMLSDDRMNAQTKKCDRETGEDQKGE